jgi:hypothetical protein
MNPTEILKSHFSYIGDDGGYTYQYKRTGGGGAKGGGGGGGGGEGGIGQNE